MPRKNKVISIGTTEAEEFMVLLACTLRDSQRSTYEDGKGSYRCPFKFVSRALRVPELNYSSMEKLVVSALVIASKRHKRPRISVKGSKILADIHRTERPEEGLSGYSFGRGRGTPPNHGFCSTDDHPARLVKRRRTILTNTRLKTNGLVERANRGLGEGIKARLEAKEAKLDGIIPAEIGMPTLKTEEVDLVQNNEALEINLDLLEGNGDTGKLGPKWEGPYEVMEALEKGAYKLKDRDGKQLPLT
ncbi:hypothetical protein Tco_1194191 [Tanacetum coccineum]